METSGFNSIVIETKEVLKDLKTVCSTYKLPLENLDFHLLQTTTFFRKNPLDKWQKLLKENKSEFESDEFLLQENLEIYQTHKIEIFKSDKKNINSIQENITLGSNKLFTTVVAFVKKDFDVDIYKNLQDSFIKSINKKKARSGLLVGIREENMQEEVEKISKRILKEGSLSEDVSFKVMEFIKPVHCVDDKLVVCYKQNSNEEANDKTDEIIFVEKDELILEHVKAKKGMNGRNCKGKLIKVREPLEYQVIKVHVGDNIAIKEDEDSIKYISKKQGYLKEENGIYDVKDELEFDGLDIKTTSSIKTNLDSDIVINVKENDEIKDAIGAGMRIETSVLKVDGSVSNKAHIKANDVYIGGQTHKGSFIQADKVFVAAHKGVVEGGEIEIERLDGGKVTAKVARIKNAIGGIVIAKEIYIDTLMSNAVLIASNLIEIESVKGSNNKLSIDLSEFKDISDKLKAFELEIKNIKKRQQEIFKLLEEKRQVIKNNKEVMGFVKERIEKLQNDNVIPPKNLTTKLKEYKQLLSDYNELVREFNDKKQQIRDIKKQIELSQGDVFNARIITHSPWTDFNEIKFKLLYPPIEATHSTRRNKTSRTMSLKKISEDKYELKRLTEQK